MSRSSHNEAILWNALFEASWDGMVVLKCDGHLYRVNQRYAEMLGYTREELESMHVWDLDTRFSRPEIETMLARVDDTGAHFETQQRRKDGRRIDVELRNNGATYQGLKLIFCIVRDITARKATEERVTTMAITDGLTGILNRQEFGRLLEKEMARASRYASPLSLIMYDLDHFKRINDRFGHNAGDDVLKTVAGLVGECLRDTDLHGRWGGEEFMVLLPETGLAAAGKVAEKLRRAIADHRFEGPGGVTASFGVAQMVPGEDSRSLAQRVDEALYRAKALGRNRVES